MFSITSNTDITKNKAICQFTPQLLAQYGVDGIKFCIGSDSYLYEARKPKGEMSDNFSDRLAWKQIDSVVQNISLAPADYISGDKNQIWSITADTSLFKSGYNDVTKLIDGSNGRDIYFNDGIEIANKWVEVEFEKDYIVMGFKIDISNNTDEGVWKFQGYETNSDAWYDLTEDVSLVGSMTGDTLSASQSRKYKKVKFLGVSGTTSSNPWLYDINFKIKDSIEFDMPIRLNPVSDENKLKAIKAKDYMRVKVKSTNKEYVFSLGGIYDEERGDIKDDADTGVWTSTTPDSSQSINFNFMLGNIIHAVPDSTKAIYEIKGQTITDPQLAGWLISNPISGFIVSGNNITLPDWTNKDTSIDAPICIVGGRALIIDENAKIATPIKVRVQGDATTLNGGAEDYIIYEGVGNFIFHIDLPSDKMIDTISHGVIKNPITGEVAIQQSIDGGDITVDVVLKNKISNKIKWYEFSVFRGAGGNISEVLFMPNAKIYDTENVFDLDTSTYTCQEDGIYSFSWNAFSNDSNQGQRAAIYKNGNIFIQTGQNVGITSDSKSVLSSVEVDLVVGDTIQLRASTGELKYYGSRFHNLFTGHKVNPSLTEILSSDARIANKIKVTVSGDATTINGGKPNTYIYEGVLGQTIIVDIPSDKIIDTISHGVVKDARTGDIVIQQIQDGGDLTINVTLKDKTTVRVWRVVSEHRETIAVNSTSITTGHDLETYTSGKIIFSFTDRHADGGGRPWHELFIDIAEFKRVGKTYLWNHDNAYIQVVAENWANGTFKFYDYHRDAVYVHSRLEVLVDV